jgi:hypothetical protein
VYIITTEENKNTLVFYCQICHQEQRFEPKQNNSNLCDTCGAVLKPHPMFLMLSRRYRIRYHMEGGKYG